MKTKIYTQHNEHTQWLNKLAFYKDDSKLMQKRLEEVSDKNTSEEIRKEVEHFQNQFFIQEKNLSTIVHHIAAEEKQIQNSIKENPIASDHRMEEDHVREREMVESFEDNFNGLRKEFYAFLAKRM